MEYIIYMFYLRPIYPVATLKVSEKIFKWIGSSSTSPRWN